MKNFLWFVFGLIVASGVVVAQNRTLTEQLLTDLNTATTNGSQKSQVVDGSGNVIASTSNALNVNVNNATTALRDDQDGIATTSSAANSPTNGYLYTFNGTTFDRVRSIKGGSIQVANGANTYQHIAASQTATVLQTSTGAAGDYLSHCIIYPSTTGAGSVTVFDNTNAAATNVIEFTTGTLSNLAPITIPVGAVSTSGAWKVTTGANETVVCVGKFS